MYFTIWFVVHKMDRLFHKIVARVLPRNIHTPVGRWSMEPFAVVKKPQSPVGRWSLETCDKKINARIDRSNEDHCGPCGLKPS